MHCSKPSVRSRLWVPEMWPALDGGPILTDWVIEAGATEKSHAEIQPIHDADTITRMY
jgi:hypothetical protein